MKSQKPANMQQGAPDDFQTPPLAARPLLKYLPHHWVIWECAAGKGNLVELFQDYDYAGFATDKYETADWIESGVDFLNEDTWTMDIKEVDCIVTNPPFAHKDKFLSKCYELELPFALLLPVTALGGQRRQKLYRKHGLQILMLGKRIHFETPSGKGGGAWQEHAWFTWGLGLPSDLHFAELP